MPTSEQSEAIIKIVQALEILKTIPAKAIEKDSNRLELAITNLDIVSMHLWEEIGVPRDLFINANKRINL